MYSINLKNTFLLINVNEWNIKEHIRGVLVQW